MVVGHHEYGTLISARASSAAEAVALGKKHDSNPDLMRQGRQARKYGVPVIDEPSFEQSFADCRTARTPELRSR